MLELIDLVKHYRGGSETVRAVDGVSLSVAPGEIVAVYGPSGSGKTTLLQLVAGLLDPDSGRIVFDGRDLAAMSPDARAAYRRRDVGLVFQSFHLIPGASALDNAAVKLLADGHSLREARARALPWLERLGLGERVDQAAAKLSMGERQRVAIVRALASEPRLLLADEPTGNLDSARSRATLELLRDVCWQRQIAGVVVTHDPEAVSVTSAVYTLRDGQLRDGLDVEHAPIST
jgi:putative ABC transport system ATP-binding protein